MPSIIPIHPPKSPVRRMPKSVRMSEFFNSPWACIHCRKVARTYADGAVFCENCQCKLGDMDRIDISRGRQRNTISLAWVPIKME